MRQPNSPWNHDYRFVTQNPNLVAKDQKLEVDGKVVDFDTFMADQRARALAMRAATRGKR